ncbi:sigma-70 family RNA polymerase sigma factor [Actinophytocola oryzae]|uniref:RNA polymerase sigma factor (Sigma-70 family) n=1 Tax=Actinophytocola oryzae TaxID=502181 RepID=A0A4R7VRR0_9PSEU|nr:sigma-70 family RNA polymerase sigma factor [Actinophytocola oryzae]TDV51907.1 RNA polymerase sigma factor (sigma-70 family) [Actinophytocola oryzae]
MNWEQIYNKYRPVMIEVAARCLRERADVDAADVVHEVFTAVMCDPPPEEPDWYGYFTGMIENLCAGRVEYYSAPVKSAEQLENPEDVAVRRVDACDVRRRLLRVMAYMTERQCEVTRLRLFDGLTVGEIAATVNTSSSNVSQIVIRCLIKLEPVLTQLETFDRKDLEALRPPRRMR